MVDSQVDTAGDAAIADGGTDGPVADASPLAQCDPNAPPGLVRVHSPSTNAPVVVHGSDGHYISTGFTDATGVASVMVPGCGAVTLALSAYYKTVTHLSAGADVWPEERVVLSQTQGPFGLAIDVPQPGDNGYMITPQITAGGPTVYSVYWHAYHLTSSGTTSLLVQPVRIVGGQNEVDPGTYAFFDDFTPGQPMHVTAWSTSPPPRHVTFHLPFVADQTRVFARSEAHGLRFYRHQYSATVTSANPEVDLRFPEVGEGAVVEVEAQFGQSLCYWYHDFAAPLATPMDVDLTTQLVPRVASVNQTSDAVRPTVSWTVGRTAFDAFHVKLYGDNKAWGIWVPPDVASLRVPELPANLAVSFAQHLHVPGVASIERAKANGYPDIRSPPDPRFMFPGDTDQGCLSEPGASW